MHAWGDSFNVVGDGNPRPKGHPESHPEDWQRGLDGKYYRLVPLPGSPSDVNDRWCAYISRRLWPGRIV
jgi:hypothetical protein